MIWDQIYSNSVQFGFMSGCGTTDTIFILCQQDLPKKKDIYFMFVDL